MDEENLRLREKLALACRELQVSHDALQSTVGELQSVTDELERLNGLLTDLLDTAGS